MNLIIIPFHDWRKSQNEGFRTRDVHFIKSLSDNKNVDKILVINRPSTWLEHLYKGSKKNVKGELLLNNRNFSLTKVDHNIYIGEDLTYNRPFNKNYLYNLRLWQLVTMCEMENRFYQLHKTTPIKLDASSLILVFNATLSIRYRMDEKKFDVDGTYNARYEIIKKRIDKAFIKDTEERISQKGKLTIIYSHNSDEEEYLKYVKYLQTRNYLGDQIELLELEDVQGVIGLRALRVNIIYQKNVLTPENEIDRNDLAAYLSK